MSVFYIRYFLFVAPLLFLTAKANAQSRNTKGDQSFSQSGVNEMYRDATEANKHRNKKKPDLYLVYNTKGILNGNPCVREVTNKMGFEYMVICPGKPSFRERTYIYFYNRMTAWGIFFRNGPFWRHKLKRRIQDCRQKTGDYTN